MGLPDFALYDLSVGGGQIALSPAPGRGSYQHDLAAIAAWGADMVLTMTTLEELDRVGARGLADDLEALGIAWRHLPIADFGAPDGPTAKAWPPVEAEALSLLSKAGKILIHCYGGCGRSGMAALRLMVAQGEPIEDALIRLRRARPCAVETLDQLDWARG
jgi:hypothetical protein